jgi:hypothetical protein
MLSYIGYSFLCFRYSVFIVQDAAIVHNIRNPCEMITDYRLSTGYCVTHAYAPIP